MSTITFDTFKFVDRLEKAGMPREQAAAIVDAQKDAFAEALDTNVATRSDLAALKSELKADIVRLDNKIDNRFESLTKDMQAMELRLTIKLGSIVVVAIGVVAALVKLA